MMRCGRSISRCDAMRFWRNVSFILAFAFFGAAAAGHFYHRENWSSYKYTILKVPSLLPGDIKEVSMRAEFDTFYVVFLQDEKPLPEGHDYFKCRAAQKPNRCEQYLPRFGVDWNVTDGRGYSKSCNSDGDGCRIRGRKNQYEIGGFQGLSGVTYTMRIRRDNADPAASSVRLTVGLGEKKNTELIILGQLAGVAWAVSIALGAISILLGCFLHWRYQVYLKRQLADEISADAS